MSANPLDPNADPAFLRRVESLRKQRYRAAKRSEIKMLEDEVQDLTARLRTIQANTYFTSSSPRSTQIRNQLIRPTRPISSTAHVAKAVHKHTTVLRAQVIAHRKLVRKLAAWVAPPAPLPHCLSASAATWMHATTLVADPDARRCGFQWLSERVFQTALAALPKHPLGSQVVDSWKLNVHSRADSDGGMTIDAMENHCQYTVFAPVDVAAETAWSKYLMSHPGVFERKVVEIVHDRLMYSSHYTFRLGTTSHSITGLFRDGRRVVVTQVIVARDECLPQTPGEMRPYGFGWTVYEPVSPDITLVRYSTLQCTPITADGTPLELNEVGRLFGRGPRGIESTEAYIDSIAAIAEANLVCAHTAVMQAYCRELEKFEKEKAKEDAMMGDLGPSMQTFDKSVVA